LGEPGETSELPGEEMKRRTRELQQQRLVPVQKPKLLESASPNVIFYRPQLAAPDDEMNQAIFASTSRYIRASSSLQVRMRR
jgi:hypothetical protein